MIESELGGGGENEKVGDWEQLENVWPQKD